MKKRAMRTTMSWILMAHIFMAIVAYEWLPASFRGSWVFILLLLMSGAFLSVGWALILGLVAFVGVSVYFLLDLGNQSYIERQLLLVFIIPIIPVLLSAIRHNLLTNTENLHSIRTYEHKIRHDVFPLSALQSFNTQFKKLLDRPALDDYEIFRIQITNHALIEEMLGEDVWKSTQNKIIEILNQEAPEAIFHFTNQELSEICCIVIRPLPNEQLPQFIRELQEITTLRLDIEHEVIEKNQYMIKQENL